MNTIKIFVDSTCDLPEQILVENDISIIPLYLNFDEECFKDKYDINTSDLYRKIKKLHYIPKTSAPSPVTFYNSFKPYIDNGSDIIYIGLSSCLSSTIHNALLATDFFPKDRINVIDSLNVSSGIGLLVMKALDFMRNGLDSHNITVLLKELVPKIKTSFTVDNLEYLRLGGRCSSIQSTIGEILNIKPFLKVQQGKIVLANKMRGRKKALSAILNEVTEDMNIIDSERIIITHSLGIESADFLKQELLKIIRPKELIISDAGCVISSHCGENSVGIMHMTI